jgi:heme-degrading monooxygenase HmoA
MTSEIGTGCSPSGSLVVPKSTRQHWRKPMTDRYVVWITTRRIRPGTYEEFSRAWRPADFPEGMLRAYECFAEDRNEVVGISVWDSLESRERYRLSGTESERRRAMAPFVVEESSGLYSGRELGIPR